MEASVESFVMASAFQERCNRTGRGPDTRVMKGFYHGDSLLSENPPAWKDGGRGLYVDKVLHYG